MPKQFDRKSLELTAAQWAVLDALSAETNSVAPTGPNAKRPSWRTFIKRIADGDFTITK